MTATSRPAPSTTGPAVPSASSVARSWWRRWWIWWVLAGVLVAIVLGTLLSSGPPPRQLGHDVPEPAGGQAVARVLAAHGVMIHPAESLDQALDLAADHPEATVLYHDPDQHLPLDGLDRLAEGTDPARRVLVEPDPDELAALAPDLGAAGPVAGTDPLTAGTDCSLPAAQEAQTMTAGGQAYTGGTGCFPAAGPEDEPAHAVARSAEGTVVIGNPGVLANGQAAEEGNPVLSLWSLGSSGEVIWYLPGLQDLTLETETPTIGQLLPDWVRPAGVWSIICLLLAMLWQGRRHGPLATEPLPVIVPASETAVGRARLYQQSGHAEAADRALRAATLTRLAARLRLGHGAEVEAIVEAVTRATGRESAAVRALLDPPDPPGRDGARASGSHDTRGTRRTRGLVERAAALTELERSVEAGLAPGAGAPARTDAPRPPTPGGDGPGSDTPNEITDDTTTERNR